LQSGSVRFPTSLVSKQLVQLVVEGFNPVTIERVMRQQQRVHEIYLLYGKGF